MSLSAEDYFANIARSRSTIVQQAIVERDAYADKYSKKVSDAKLASDKLWADQAALIKQNQDAKVSGKVTKSEPKVSKKEPKVEPKVVPKVESSFGSQFWRIAQTTFDAINAPIGLTPIGLAPTPKAPVAPKAPVVVTPPVAPKAPVVVTPPVAPKAPVVVTPPASPKAPVVVTPPASPKTPVDTSSLFGADAGFFGAEIPTFIPAAGNDDGAEDYDVEDVDQVPEDFE